MGRAPRAHHDVGMDSDDNNVSATRIGRPPLRRTHDRRVVGGVAAGLARHLDIDPLIVRVAFVVLALFGGVGTLAYALVWLLLPADGERESLLEQLLRGRSGGAAFVAILGVLVGITAVGTVFGTGPNIGPLVVLTVLLLGAAVALRQGRERPVQADGWAVATAQVPADASAAPYAAHAVHSPPPPHPPAGLRRPRRRSARRTPRPHRRRNARSGPARRWARSP